MTGTVTLHRFVHVSLISWSSRFSCFTKRTRLSNLRYVHATVRWTEDYPALIGQTTHFMLKGSHICFTLYVRMLYSYTHLFSFAKNYSQLFLLDFSYRTYTWLFTILYGQISCMDYAKRLSFYEMTLLCTAVKFFTYKNCWLSGSKMEALCI